MLNECDGCHNLLQKATSFKEVAGISAEGNSDRTHFWDMSKDEAINIILIQ